MRNRIIRVTYWEAARAVAWYSFGVFVLFGLFIPTMVFLIKANAKSEELKTAIVTLENLNDETQNLKREITAYAEIVSHETEAARIYQQTDEPFYTTADTIPAVPAFPDPEFVEEMLKLNQGE